MRRFRRKFAGLPRPDPDGLTCVDQAVLRDSSRSVRPGRQTGRESLTDHSDRPAQSAMKHQRDKEGALPPTRSQERAHPSFLHDPRIRHLEWPIDLSS